MSPALHSHTQSIDPKAWAEITAAQAEELQKLEVTVADVTAENEAAIEPGPPNNDTAEAEPPIPIAFKMPTEATSSTKHGKIKKGVIAS